MVDRDYVDIERVIEFHPGRLVQCDGTSIWENSAGKMSEVSSIRIVHTDGGFDHGGDKMEWILIWVKHSLHWPIYTDRGFEKGVSALISEVIGLPVEICFTEQGMQADYVASMETWNKGTDKVLMNWVKEND